MDGTLIDSIGIWNEIDKELIKTVGNGSIDNIDIGKQRDEKLKQYNEIKILINDIQYQEGIIEALEIIEFGILTTEFSKVLTLVLLNVISSTVPDIVSNPI